jgi:alpha-glucosidase
VPSQDDVLSFRRGVDFACAVNFGADPVPLPADAEVVLGSAPIADGALPSDTAVWLRLTRDSRD